MGVDTLMNTVLEVYFPNCRYLKSADFHYPEIKGEFGISSSCYIESTGHFNAVEAIICYNQLAYTFFAHGIDERIEELMKLETLSFGDFSFAGFKLPSREMHLSINAFIKVEILKLLIGVAKIIASAQRTLS